IAFRPARASFGYGLGTIDQRAPSQRSTNVRNVPSTGLYAPTAQAEPLVGARTASRYGPSWPIHSAGTRVHFQPFQCSISSCGAPTPRAQTSDADDPPIPNTSPLTRGLPAIGTTLHLEPSQCSAR